MNVELEELAKKHVGNPNSNLTFVTVCGVVTAVFVNNQLAAENFAKAFVDVPAIVENKDGIVFENHRHDYHYGVCSCGDSDEYFFTS